MVEPVKRRVLAEQVGVKIATELGLDAPVEDERVRREGAREEGARGDHEDRRRTLRGRAIAARARWACARRRTACAKSLFNILDHGIEGFSLCGRACHRSFRRHRCARARGHVARRRVLPVRRRSGGGARADPHQHRSVLRLDGRHAHLPPRCDRSRAGRHRGAVCACLPRSAIRQGARRARARRACRRRMAGSRGRLSCARSA